MPPDPENQLKSASWFKAVRSQEAMELLRANANAFALAYVIAYRARYREGFNADGLERGEAMLGDHKNYGMSERQYRTAKHKLEKWGFATFKTTNKGTMGKLTDTRLFNPLNMITDGQNDRQPTDERRTNDGRATTNKNDNKENNEEGTRTSSGFSSFSESSVSASEFQKPSLEDVRQCMEASGDGLKRYAERWLKLMEKQNWEYPKGTPVRKWQPFATSYAQRCPAPNKARSGSIPNPRNVGLCETPEQKSADVAVYMARQKLKRHPEPNQMYEGIKAIRL